MKNFEVLDSVSHEGKLLGAGSVIAIEDGEVADSLLKRNLVRVTEASTKIVAPARRKIEIKYDTTDEKHKKAQDELLQRLAVELESGKATDTISGRVKIGDYNCIVTWTLNQLGYSGEKLEGKKALVNYKNNIIDSSWADLRDKYLMKASLEGLSHAEAKAKLKVIVDRGYAMIRQLEGVYDKHKESKKAKTSKAEAQKPYNKKWYE